MNVFVLYVRLKRVTSTFLYVPMLNAYILKHWDNTDVESLRVVLLLCLLNLRCYITLKVLSF